MENKIKISIIMASYNYEYFIGSAIESIIGQTYPHWELIIVDDGSNDNSVEVIKKYCEKDNRIKLFQHENAINKGLKDTILLGMEKSSFEWITFLESDDLYKPNYLEEKVNAIKNNPDAKMIFNDVEVFGDENEIKNCDSYLSKRDSILKNTKIKYKDLLVVNLIPSFSCVMIKKNVLKTCDFNSPVRPSLDYFLWTQLYSKLQMIYLPKKLTLWRKHAKNYTRSADYSRAGAFDLKLLKFLAGDNHNNMWFLIYNFIRDRRIEKICRPQASIIGEFIFKILLKDKFYEFIKIS